MTPLQKAAFMTWLKVEGGYTSVRLLSEDQWAGIMRFMFTDAIIVGKIGDRHGYTDRWCYEHGKALQALDDWNGEGEPQGWHRHPDTGRRREHGDPLTEYINR